MSDGQCKQCGGDMVGSHVPFCCCCLNRGIDDEHRHLLPNHGGSRSFAIEKETTDQRSLDSFAEAKQ